jgi:hypothetical protein
MGRHWKSCRCIAAMLLMKSVAAAAVVPAAALLDACEQQ